MSTPFLLITWFFRMLRDVVWLGHVNKNYALSLAILLLLLIGLLAIGAHVSAPFIYTLF